MSINEEKLQMLVDLLEDPKVVKSAMEIPWFRRAVTLEIHAQDAERERIEAGTPGGIQTEWS